MNVPDYIHVPNSSVSYEYILNRQNNNEYLLNNITRCAVIFNYLNNKTDNNILVENIYDEFCGVEDPSIIPIVFLNNFELFMNIYLLERFGKMYNIFISEGEIKNITYPIHAFCVDNTIVVLYSLEDLKTMIQNISLYQYMYFNEKYFLMPRKGCENNGRNLESLLYDQTKPTQNDEDKLRETLTEIQKNGKLNSELNMEYSNQFSSYCFKLNSNNNNINNQPINNFADCMKNTNEYQIKNTNQLKDTNKKNTLINDDNMPNDFFQLQANFSTIWSPQNHVPLTYLIMITQILEIAIRPILCSILTTTVTRNVNDKKINIDQLYKEFLSTFTHSITIDINANTQSKDNKSTDFKYMNLNLLNQ